MSEIVDALAAGASECVKPDSVQPIKDAYAAFKALIVRKYSAAATPVQAVEERPASESRRRVLDEELVDAGADRDPDVLVTLQALVGALNQYAPKSVANLAASGAAAGALSGAASRSPNHETIRTDGGAVIRGPVTTGGGTFVGRDQIINNITLRSVDQIQDLTAVLRASIAQLGIAPEPDALDNLGAVLDEISKLYQLIDTEFTKYLALSFDDPQQVSRDRAVLLSLDGGQIKARASEARGHCEKFTRIYHNQLRDWFKDRLRLDAGAMARVDRAFDVLGSSDLDMVFVIGQLAQWLSDKATRTLNLVDAGDLAGARRLVRDGRLDSHAMRQKLARTISAMRDIQAELLRLAP
jgi:hypothetical protein